MPKKLTQSRLKELLHYDPEIGNFTWREGNQVAGYINKHIGYRLIGIDGKYYNASRLAWLYMEGYFPENDVDHKNRIRHDNRWENLLHASHQCNMRNCKKRITNKSGITGVSWLKRDQKWRAGITIFYKSLNLGHFTSKFDAAHARWEAEVKYDFPSCNTTSTAYQYLKNHGTP